eukprot:g12207.t1
MWSLPYHRWSSAIFFREYEEKIGNLNQDLAGQKQELLSLFEQRQEVLQSKIEMEKHEVLARVAEMREELQGVDSLNAVSISDMELKTMNNLELFKKREEAERDALRSVVDSKLNQVVGQIARTETLRQDGLTALYEKIDDFQNKQLETVKEIRGEVHENIRDVQTLFKDEMRHRMETERKMTESVREVVKNLSHNQTQAFEQLSDRLRVFIALISSESLGESRKEGAERAERMSRYVDEVVAKWRLDYGQKCDAYDAEVLRMQDRIAELLQTLTRTKTSLDDKIDSTKTALIEKQEMMGEKFEESLKLTNKKFEERQARQENWSAQEFAFVKQKQERSTADLRVSIAAVHRAILGLSKDKSMIGANIVVPLPSWDRIDSAREKDAKAAAARREEQEMRGMITRTGAAASSSSTDPASTHPHHLAPARPKNDSGLDVIVQPLTALPLSDALDH